MREEREGDGEWRMDGWMNKKGLEELSFSFH